MSAQRHTIMHNLVFFLLVASLPHQRCFPSLLLIGPDLTVRGGDGDLYNVSHLAAWPSRLSRSVLHPVGKCICMCLYNTILSFFLTIRSTFPRFNLLSLTPILKPKRIEIYVRIVQIVYIRNKQAVHLIIRPPSPSVTHPSPHPVNKYKDILVTCSQDVLQYAKPGVPTKQTHSKHEKEIDRQHMGRHRCYSRHIAGTKENFETKALNPNGQ